MNGSARGNWNTAMMAEWHLPRVRAVVGATTDAEVLAFSEAVDHAMADNVQVWSSAEAT